MKCEKYIVIPKGSDGYDYVLPYELHTHQKQRDHLIILLSQAAASIKEFYPESHIPYKQYYTILLALKSIVENGSKRGGYIPGQFVFAIPNMLNGIFSCCPGEINRLSEWCSDYVIADFKMCDKHMRRALRDHAITMKNEMKLDLKKLCTYICSDGAEYYASQPDFKAAWQNCDRGDWMLYIIKNLGIDGRKITLCAGRIAETVVHLMVDPRSIAAVQGAIAYGEGRISKSKLVRLGIAAATATCDAADAADDTNTSRTAMAASVAADSATTYATHAADDAADAVDDSERCSSLKQSADICREILTEEVFAAIDKIENNN